MTQQKNNNTSKRGFASMDQEKQRKIASMGGKAAHQAGTAHEFTSEEARAAGRKGGQARSVRMNMESTSSEDEISRGRQE